MGSFNRNDSMRIKHFDPDNLIFSLFTNKELKKLCVTKIYTPLMFDALGYPLSGGLYDKSLGPMTDRSEPCGTCYKNLYMCPGHFGYIELPLPVVNPLFHKTIASILKITCFRCHKIQIPEHIKYCLSLQIKLLSCGLSTEAIVIESKIQYFASESGGDDTNEPSENALQAVREYENLIKNTIADKSVMINKNLEALRNEFVVNKLKFIKSKEVCLFCKQAMDRIQSLRNRIILSVNKSRAGELKGEVRSAESKYINPEESRKILRKVWQNEKEFLGELIPVLTGIKIEHPIDVLYMDLIPVTPPNIRPVNIVRGRIIENRQSQLYREIVQNVMVLQAIIQVVQNKEDTSSLSVEAKGVYSYAQGKTPIEKLNFAWENLQLNIDSLVDKSKFQNIPGDGLKQVLEKKAGLIRMHMMGKRVNFSARSVITPDPNLNIEEIGIPEEFAKNLTYPVPVTSWNVEELRKMIMNGPKVHPGALMVEYEDGSIKRINASDTVQKESIIKRLLTPDDKEKGFTGVKKVHRHLCNGDILLLNRQPTLHRPSIMAHTARILKGEKTLRLHYANCKAYNADFDGDEMNAHFPQNELARSEGYNLAHVCNQYLVPKDGTPLSGLIQDHVISGVRLSIRGKFFTKIDYEQLVFQALSLKTSQIILLPPTIIKPACMWSGKQILSTVLINIIPSGQHLINLSSTAKIGAKAWQSCPERPWNGGGSPFTDERTMSEAEVIIRNGELLVGVLDKTHYGATPFGLVHCVYELYGGPYATKLLSSFAKLFTYYLQMQGFTLGVHDILVTEKADKKRKKIVIKSRKIGKSVMALALDVSEDLSKEEMVERIEEATFRNSKMRPIIDREYKSALDSYTNDINRTCLPAGLICKFPQNNLQLMVSSGAKGSTVNTMQISCLLGQIELEGKRPPVMISGKSLPSFPAFEFSPRAGGFIDGRFMTGIQPQEFFFHCMAGREGLIDTAVKTSRSGYLQRCLIKHLEGLSVGYDLTVRDSDRSVIQFLYGEDGMDILKAQFLNSKQMKFLMDNRKAIISSDTLKMLKNKEDLERIKGHLRTVEDWKNKKQTSQCFYRNPFTLFSSRVQDKIDVKNPRKISRKTGRDRLTKNIVGLWHSADETLKQACKEECTSTPNPLNAELQPDVYYGALSDYLLDLLSDCKKSRPKKEGKEIEKMTKLKAMQSLCVPGEPVGLLAAQSIGEPSTQMTLNTFHFAGRGEMNVTLGIPRLREILMMASKNIKTPSMEIPFLNVSNLEKKAERLRKTLTRVTVADVLEKIDVTGELQSNPVRQMVYTLRFSFLPYRLYKSKYNAKPRSILKHMTKKFFSLMFTTMRKYIKINTNVVVYTKERQSKQTANDDEEKEDYNETKQTTKASENNREDSDVSDDEPEDNEDAKLTSKHQQAHDDQEPEEEEQEQEFSDEGENGDDDDEPSSAPMGEDEASEEAAAVINAHGAVQNYTFDTVNHLWCEVTFALPLSYKKLDLTAVLKEVANRSVVWETPNIKRAITYRKDDQLMLRTDGINIIEMSKYKKILDLNKLYSNDIHRVAETYGIEAAVRVIVKEVKEVFKVYGIAVDPRHLSLIADYMTFNGTFEPLNRTGLNSSASPLQQMSFEASLTFLKTAVAQGKRDQLQSPSSCLMVGKPCSTGTGAFTLMQKLPLKC